MTEQIPFAPSLKPCPFCGSEAALRVSHPHEDNTEDTLYTVHCTGRECGVRTLTWYPLRAVIDMWNRR